MDRGSTRKKCTLQIDCQKIIINAIRTHHLSHGEISTITFNFSFASLLYGYDTLQFLATAYSGTITTTRSGKLDKHHI